MALTVVGLQITISMQVVEVSFLVAVGGATPQLRIWARVALNFFDCIK